MDRQTPDPLTEDERTNQISTASAVIGTPSDGDDVIDGGFLLEPLNGLGGIDLLIVDYSGSSPGGRLPEGGVAFEILSGTGPEAVIDYGDGTRDEIDDIANFERLDATGSAFDDIH